jgi:DedD protein
MANGPSPTVEEIQLRKRARRRLIGAVTLVAVMVTVLPMVLDDEPKPVGQDIAINIPSQQSNDFPLKAAKPVMPVEQPAAPVAPPQALPVQPEKPLQAEKPPTPKMAEVKPVSAPAQKEEKPADKPKPPPEKSVEAKPASKAAEAPPGGGAYVVMLGAFLSEDNAKQRQAKLKALGIKYYLEKIKSPAGEKTGVRAGPYASRQDAEHALSRLKAAGIQDGLVAEKK